MHVGLGVVTLALLVGLGSCAWDSWTDEQHEA
jgi:hypothetical protein